jgi:hypothetical protein
MKNKAQRIPAYDAARQINDLQKKVDGFRKDGSMLRSFDTLWVSSGTQPALGNGTLVSTYRRDGLMCWVNYTLTWGSTTTAGTGFWTFSTPFKMSTVPGIFTGTCLVHDVSASTWYTGVSQFWDPTLNQIVFFCGQGVTGVGTGNPITWATGDFLAITMYYPTAS